MDGAPAFRQSNNGGRGARWENEAPAELFGFARSLTLPLALSTFFRNYDHLSNRSALEKRFSSQ